MPRQINIGMRAFAYSSMVPAREGIRDGNEMENGIKEFIGGGKKSRLAEWLRLMPE